MKLVKMGWTFRFETKSSQSWIQFLDFVLSNIINNNAKDIFEKNVSTVNLNFMYTLK